jgi:hypothetical protein
MTGPWDRVYDGALSSIRNGAEDLAVALAIWEARDDTRADAHARRAALGAVDAIDAIDAMLRALHAIRERLITEIRASDDATAVRVDKLLAESADAMTTSTDRASEGPTGPGKPKAGRWSAQPAKKEILMSSKSNRAG